MSQARVKSRGGTGEILGRVLLRRHRGRGGALELETRPSLNAESRHRLQASRSAMSLGMHEMGRVERLSRVGGLVSNSLGGISGQGRLGATRVMGLSQKGIPPLREIPRAHTWVRPYDFSGLQHGLSAGVAAGILGVVGRLLDSLGEFLFPGLRGAWGDGGAFAWEAAGQVPYGMEGDRFQTTGRPLGDRVIEAGLQLAMSVVGDGDGGGPRDVLEGLTPAEQQALGDAIEEINRQKSQHPMARGYSPTEAKGVARTFQERGFQVETIRSLVPTRHGAIHVYTLVRVGSRRFIVDTTAARYDARAQGMHNHLGVLVLPWEQVETAAGDSPYHPDLVLSREVHGSEFAVETTRLQAAHVPIALLEGLSFIHEGTSLRVRWIEDGRPREVVVDSVQCVFYTQVARQGTLLTHPDDFDGVPAWYDTQLRVGSVWIVGPDRAVKILLAGHVIPGNVRMDPRLIGPLQVEEIPTEDKSVGRHLLQVDAEALVRDFLELEREVKPPISVEQGSLPVVAEVGASRSLDFSALVRHPALAFQAHVDLDEPRRRFIGDMQATRQHKLREGLWDYWKEVTGRSDDYRVYRSEFIRWAHQNHRELGLDVGDVYSFRAQYLYIKSLEMQQAKVRLTSYLLQGEVDSFGKVMPIHIEIYRPEVAQIQGAIFLLTGYGESIAMYDQIIDRFLQAGYAVAAVDQRGHGFSGHPLGFEGYMDSTAKHLADLDQAFRFVAGASELQGLPLHGFGFCQGALFLTILKQYYSEGLQKLFLISPVHREGKNFKFIGRDQLPRDIADATFQNFAGLAVDRVSLQNRGGNLAPQAYAHFKLGEHQARQRAQRWLDRGLIPPYFVIRDSAITWRQGGDFMLDTAAARGDQALDGLIVLSDQDPISGGTSSLLHSHQVFNNLGTDAGGHVIVQPGRKHQLLLEPPEIVEPIFQRILTYLQTH